MKPFLLFVSLFISSFAFAQNSAAEKAVLEVEKQRFDAQVTRNYAVLEKTLGDELLYNHSNGNQDTKQSYIQSLKDGKQSYESIGVQEQTVHVYGNTAVITGICLVKATNNGQSINSKLRYTDVYVKKGAQWQMVAWQSLKLAN
ncbi:nuclear transport factor 2 family protein [Larkinella rosea]|uniref:Nuclear transport factor 2 family protein n=1 Tax=Larkinella rosea TaxID=2025312 RepID=A0A3P1B941_9BACT|nr:nuclear transport factor 2 family protein [Larkinella rosea]RRA97610.1 nuclear transport factor 2 family protein [Larkinella rosea]